MAPSVPMDSSLFRSINRFADRTPWLHGVAVGYANWGIALFAVLLLLAWWDARSADDAATAVAAVCWAGAAALVGALGVQLIGAPIDRARPTATLRGTHLLLERTKDFSFPSDHTTAATAVAVGLLLAGAHLHRRWYGRVGLALAILMGITRIYVGAHYPTDVLAGLALGTVVAWALSRPARALGRWVIERIGTTPLRPLAFATALPRTNDPAD